MSDPTVNERVFKELRAAFATEFTGEVSLHVQNGTIQVVEKRERYKTRELIRETAPTNGTRLP